MFILLNNLSALFMIGILLLAIKLIEHKIRTIWSQYRGLFINIVLAALFLGENIKHKYIPELTFK